MSIRGILQGSLLQEGHLDRKSPRYERIEIEKNLEKGVGREKRNEKNLVSDLMKGQETAITRRIGITEIVIELETRRGTEVVIAIVTVIVHVIAIEVRIVVVSMIEKGIMGVLVTGTEIGTVTMKLGKQTMIVGIPVIGIMTMITQKLNMIVAGMVRENEVMIMLEQMRNEDGMRMIMSTSVLKLNLMIRVMTIMGITKGGDNMITKMLLGIMTVTIIWKKMTTVTIEMPEEGED